MLTGTGARVDAADVLIVDGRISAVGSGLAVPEGAQVIDGQGRWVTPGLIDVHSHLGVYPSPAVDANEDGNESTDPVTANVWAEHFRDPQGHNVRKLRQAAGNAVAHGLPPDATLAALTRNPAEIFGVSDRAGMLGVGRPADLVLWGGDPLEVTTLAERVFVGGHPVPKRSRQTELRDRYLERLRRGEAR